MVNPILGTSYRIEDILDMDETRVQEMLILIRLIPNVRKFWGNSNGR